MLIWQLHFRLNPITKSRVFRELSKALIFYEYQRFRIFSLENILNQTIPIRKGEKIMTLFDRIKQLCDEKGLTIMALEQKAGLGNAVIAAWKTSSPRLDSLKKVSDALDMTFEELLKGVEYCDSAR